MEVRKLTGNKLNRHQQIWEASEVIDGETLTVRHMVKRIAIDALRAKVQNRKNSVAFEAAIEELESILDNLARKSED